MRRILLLALILLAFVALTAPAIASDHTVRITEIQTGQFQFVELQDSVDEPFPSQPYRLVFYDARGNRTGSENLSRNELDKTGTNPYTVAAFAGANENLTGFPIAPDKGQVCFTRGSNEERVHCVSFGCVTNPVRSDLGGNDPAPVPTGAEEAPPKGFPSSSESSQRQGSGRYHLANPTPDATNVAGRREFTCIINGDDAANEILGTPFDDLIRGFGGDDFIQSFAGKDRIRAGSGRDRVLAGADRDRIFGGSGRDRLRGNSGRDRIRGESGNDRLFGGSGNDRLNGGRGRDRIYGNSGTDIISGGPGLDLLRGGPGIDITTQ